MNVKRIDAKDMIERIRSRHVGNRSFPGKGKDIGIVAGFDSRTVVKRGKENATILSAIATTDRVDLDSEVVIPQGGVFDYIQTNRAVFVDHSYDHTQVVGALRSWTPWPNAANQRGWSMSVEVLQNHPYPVPEAVMNIADQMGMGVSIGFEALDGGKPDEREKRLYPGAEYVIRSWRLLEVSFTCMPCNVDCRSFGGVIDKSRENTARRLLDIGEKTDDARRLLNLRLPMLEVVA